MNSPRGEDMSTQALPISEAKARLSELVRKVGLGFEVLTTNKHGSGQLVSLVETEILTAALRAMQFTLVESEDQELGLVTISVKEIPVYGEGRSREQAIESLLDAVLDYRLVYEENIQLFSRVDSAETRGLMLKLMRCGDDRQAVGAALGL